MVPHMSCSVHPQAPLSPEEVGAQCQTLTLNTTSCGQDVGDTDAFSASLAAYEGGAAQLEHFYSRFKCSFWQAVPGDGSPEAVAAAGKVVVERVLKARADAAHCQVLMQCTCTLFQSGGRQSSGRTAPRLSTGHSD
jgi:hypothetical protein